ncbi:AraC family ligand binding domain-containing protein [Actinoplanes missouriensis]|uniref:AraC family ligand binding domain-containing protein n=1 Tax=Actinoplanes missouriensis TaxID=1866 RepID=UPI0033E6CE41
MGDLPVEQVDALMHIVDGSPAFAGRYLHEGSHPAHTHSFVEVAVVVGGSGVQHSLAGQQRLTVGDVLLLLRPGVWHGYEQCHALGCFTSELLRRELAWTREDPWIGHLLWTGPYAHQRRGMLTGHVGDAAFRECVEHLERLQGLRGRPVPAYKADLVGGLILFLSALARALGPADPGSWASVSHPAVLDGMRLMEARPAHPWTLTDLATQVVNTSRWLESSTC